MKFQGVETRRNGDEGAQGGERAIEGGERRAGQASQPLLTGSFPSQASPLSYIHCLSST